MNTSRTPTRHESTEPAQKNKNTYAARADSLLERPRVSAGATVEVHLQAPYSYAPIHPVQVQLTMPQSEPQALSSYGALTAAVSPYVVNAIRRQTQEQTLPTSIATRQPKLVTVPGLP